MRELVHTRRIDLSLTMTNNPTGCCRTEIGDFLCSRLQEFGGARRDRTDDLMLAKHALSQLSYSPEALPAPIGPDVRYRLRLLERVTGGQGGI